MCVNVPNLVDKPIYWESKHFRKFEEMDNFAKIKIKSYFYDRPPC